METTIEKSEAYKVILQQLGGNRFIVMTGSKNFVYSNNGNTLSMHLTRNKAKAKYLKITLNSMDTYDMVFSTLKGKKFEEVLVEVVKHEGVYCDQLQEIFTEVTGLYTHL